MKIIFDSAQSMRSQIAEYFRARIRTGELGPGDRLPAARELARELGIAEAGVHHAIALLVGEGLVDRRPGVGSVVAATARAPRQVAFLVPWFYLQRGEEFTRLLTGLVVRKLEECRIGCQVIYDTPDGNGRRQLTELAAERRIQGVICRMIRAAERRFLNALPTPYTGLSSLRLNHRIDLLNNELARRMATELAHAGATRAGVVMALRQEVFLTKLAGHCRRLGLEWRPEWVCDAISLGAGDGIDSAACAWRACEYYRTLAVRPDGLLLVSDDVVYGLAMAFYRYGVQVPSDYKIVVHHTCENPVIFPFPCRLVQHSIAEIADQLVEQLLRLMQGAAVKPPRLTLRTVLLEPEDAAGHG